MNILTDSRQMKQCDENTIHHFKVPSLVLMERAALWVVEEIEKQVPEGSRILLVCGAGNNGGDGLAAGRILWQKGYYVTIVMPGNTDQISEETNRQKEMVEVYGIEILTKMPIANFDVVVDALFGIGITRELQGIYLETVKQMNRMEGYKIAVDIPSGIHADNGTVMGEAFCADVTVTFAFQKLGTIFYPGAEYSGRVKVRDIGICAESFLGQAVKMWEIEETDLLHLPKRKEYSNKGTFGKVLVAAGCKNMAGAAFLSGKAAYIAGAGFVKIYTAEANRQIIQQLLPEAVVETYDPNENLSNKLEEAIKKADVIVAGPGIGVGESSERIIKTILQNANVPVILDADGLNIISNHREWLKEAKYPIIITPHLGEMARLVQKSIIDIQKQLLQVAQEFAKEYNVICILKDARTVTALPDGTVFINTSGNNGMATAGTGDVLTGVLAGLIAQGMDENIAAPVGVYLHGSGGDCILKETGTYSMTSQDIIAGVRKIIKERIFDKGGN